MKLTTYLQHIGTPYPKAVHYFARLVGQLRIQHHSFGALVFAFLLLPVLGQAQVSVTGAVTGNGSYATLEAAFTAINGGAQTGANILVEISASTSETNPCVLNSNDWTSLTIRPSNDGVTVSGATVTGRGLVELNGADNVTIDGDNPNTSGTNRNLTFTNTAANTITYTSVIRLAVLAATQTSADGNTIRNCNINGSATGRNAAANTSTTGSENTTFGIYAGGNGGATVPTALTSVTANSAPTGTTINNLTVNNNAVNACARAIYFNGAVIGVSPGTLTVTNNLVGDQVVNNTGNAAPYTSPTTSVYTKGIYIAGTTTAVVTGNTLKNIGSYVSTQTAAIEMSTAMTGSSVTVNNNTITSVYTNAGSATYGVIISSAPGATCNINGNTITHVTSATAASAGISATYSGTTTGSIQQNTISNIKQRSGGFAANGIRIVGGSGWNIINNCISDILNTGSTSFSNTFNTTGICLTSGSNHKVYHNTVNLTGNSTSIGSNSVNCFSISTNTQTGIDVRNNLFANTVTGGAATDAHVCVFLPFVASGTMNLTINNNAYFYGTIPSRSGIGFTGATTFNAANINTTLASFQAFTQALGVATNDNASYATTNAVPLSGCSVDISSAEAINLNGTGATGTGVTVDITGDPRGTPPDIGADEFILSSCAAANGGTITPGTASRCAGQTYTMTSVGAEAGLGITYQWEVSTTGGGVGFSDVSGGSGATSTSYTTAALTVGTYYYRLRVTCSFGPVTGYSNELVLTVNPTPTASASNNGPACVGGTINLTGTTDIGTSYSWSGPGGFSSMDQNPVLSSVTTSNSGVYSFTATAGGCTSAPAPTTVVVSNLPVISSITATPNPVCNGGNSQLQVVASTPIAANALNFSASTGSLDPMSGATTAIGTSNDDTPSSVQSIGFTFPFNGVDYTQFSVSPDGWILLGSATATSQFTNATTSTTNIPKIYPYWDDLATGTTGNVTYVVTGTAPNRILVVQWFVTIPRNTIGAANSTFQAWLYEGSGTIEFRYGTMGTATMSASVGLTASATNYQSVTISSGTVSTTVPNDNNAGQPASGTMYSFAGTATSALWSPSTFLNFNNILNPLASGVTTTTTYTVTVTNTASCTASGTVTVTASAPITAASITPASPAFCTGGSVTLTAVPADGGAPFSYAWADPTNTPAGTSATQSANIVGIWSVTVTDNCGGSVVATQTVVENPVPTASASSNSPVCAGANLNLSVTTDIGTTFSWAGPNSFTSTDQNPTIMGVTTAAAGTYNVTVTAAGCSATSSTSVTVIPSPVIDAVTATPATICSGENSNLLVTLASSTYCAASQTSGVCGTDEWINSVTFGSISNGGQTCALGAPNNGYQNFTGLSTTLAAGSTGNVLTAGITDIFTGDQMRVWIDWNQNGVFTDPGEEYLPTGPVAATTTFNIDVPAGAFNGNTRMRVRLTFTGAILPCGSTAFGETEDYTINVTGGVDLTYSWSPATFLSSTTIPNPTATGVTTTTTYTVTVSNSLTGCSTTGNVTVTVNPNVSAGTISGTTPLCVSQTDTYTTTGTPGGTWSSDNMSIATVDPGTGLVTAVAPGTTNINYTVTTGCGSPVSTSKSVTVQSALTWYLDADGDGYYTGSPVSNCTSPGAGYVTTVTGPGDCNDSNASVYPGAPEVCDNSIDDDCDTNVDETLITWTGAGDGVNWTDGANWNNGGAQPQACNDIVIPAGADVTVPAGANVVGRTLDVDLAAALNVALTAIMTIMP